MISGSEWKFELERRALGGLQNSYRNRWRDASTATRLARLVEIIGKECMSKRFAHSDTAAHHAAVSECVAAETSIHCAYMKKLLTVQELVLMLEVLSARDAIGE